MATMKKVLALHGYSQNATIFNKRLGALRKESRDIEFVFVNAPHILQPAELDAPSEELAELQSNPDTALRGWWTANTERTKVTGFQESLLVIRDVLKSQRFDGIFGFSQGGAFAAVISSLLERPHIYPPFLVDGVSPHPPLQFCIVVSGFKVLDPICSHFYTPNYKTPTLHVIGRTDVVVIEERSRQLMEASAQKRVEEHEGGHFVPSKGPWRHLFVAYMMDPTTSHPSPVPSPGPSSGIATPSDELVMDYRAALLKKL